MKTSKLQISYKNLWIRLVERDMKRTDLLALAKLGESVALISQESQVSK